MAIHLLHETCVQLWPAGAIDTTIICQGARKRLQKDSLKILNTRIFNPEKIRKKNLSRDSKTEAQKLADAKRA